MAASLREPTYYVLAALLDGPLHGYGIMKRSRAISDGRVRLSAGTLYGALDRLAADGLVEVIGEEVVDGRVRRSYRLTGPGQDILTAEAARLARSAAIVSDHRSIRRRLGEQA
jgi:PadR family transcriptional regulator, regulatory protein PadR